MVRSKQKKESEQTMFNAELTKAEWIIMKVVWENEPCAAGTVQEALANSKAWAYSTVKSTMDRMANKGFLKIIKIRNLQLFSSIISEVDAKRGEFHKMLKRAFGGALVPLIQFLIEHEDLSKAESARLRKLVNKPNKKKD